MCKIQCFLLTNAEVVVLTNSVQNIHGGGGVNSEFNFIISNIVCLSGILEIRTVSEGGILAIKGVKSQYYISMNKAGQLQGKVMNVQSSQRRSTQILDLEIVACAITNQ